MVNAKLHIICGNCGDNEMLQLNKQECRIECLNCGTLHFLEEHFNRIKEVRGIK